MKTYFSDLIPRIKKFSKRIDDLTLLTEQHWVITNEIENSKNVYLFRKNKTLLLSNNGNVIKGKWEYLGNNSLLIEHGQESFLFKHGFFDENILALKVDGKEEYAFLVNENKYTGELNRPDHIIHFLEEKYLNTNSNDESEDRNYSRLQDYNFKIEKRLNDGRKLVIYSTSNERDEFNFGDLVTIDGDKPEDGNYHYGWTGCVTTEKGKVKW